MSDTELAHLNAILDDYTSRLGEHFDSVQILVTINNEPGTRGMFRGCGDWYARQGIAHEFIANEDADRVGQSVARFTNEC